MRVIVVGLGIQGQKRRKHANDDFIAAVDPINEEAQYKHLADVPLADYDAALLCVPDQPKVELISYLLNNQKHVLVEKPLWAPSIDNLHHLQSLARAKGVTLYTAYNHRFEPHFIRMQELLASKVLGKIYACRLFYGNGTAKLVKESPWRDQGGGVLPDLSSHLLDTLHFWFGEIPGQFRIVSSNCFETKAPDHVIFKSVGMRPQIECEMTLLSWKNHFTCDILGEHGSAHISSLCKWGPSVFTHRKRILPSGAPEESSSTLVQSDPTWASEYAYFKKLTATGKTDISRDIWLNQIIQGLTEEILPRSVTA